MRDVDSLLVQHEVVRKPWIAPDPLVQHGGRGTFRLSVQRQPGKGWNGTQKTVCTDLTTRIGSKYGPVGMERPRSGCIFMKFTMVMARHGKNVRHSQQQCLQRTDGPGSQNRKRCREVDYKPPSIPLHIAFRYSSPGQFEPVLSELFFVSYQVSDCLFVSPCFRIFASAFGVRGRVWLNFHHIINVSKYSCFTFISIIEVFVFLVLAA